MTNNQLFGVFAAQILASTFENFPIAVRVPREEMQELVSAHADIEGTQRQLSTLEGVLTLRAEAGARTKEAEAISQKRLAELQMDVHSKEKEQKRIAAVLEGTVSALVAEGFIRERESGHFQLTFNGLAHLNKRFEEGSIQGHESIADRIRSKINPTNFVGTLATLDTLVSLVGKAIAG